MNASDQKNREAVLVRAIAANVNDVMNGEWAAREWLHLFADFEIDVSADRMSAICFALARQNDGPIEKIAFRFPLEAKQILKTIANDMDTCGNKRWTVARIQIERDQSYSIDYVYAAPYRLGGRLNDTRYVDYLERWLDSDAGASYRAHAPRKWLGDNG